MCERGEVGLLSLPEEVLIKIAQHLGKWLQLAQAVSQSRFTLSGSGSMLVAVLGYMPCWIQILALLNAESRSPGFAESGSRLCWNPIQALLNLYAGFAESRSPGFAESGSMPCWNRIQALLNLYAGFVESRSRYCWIRIKGLLFPDPGFAESGSRLCWIRMQGFVDTYI